MALELNDSNFEAEVLKSDLPVLVDFWAPWCGPCRSMAPIIEELSNEYQGKVKITKLNVDQSQEIARRFGIMSIPTLIIFKNGQNVGQTVGLTPKALLAKKLDAVIED
ncbi:thioredoxin [Desulfocucumis palustris]|uniref:Thioredoxin n=1 Tax=Desulfocucumis palustris TaxID=1898651 RepID=A0A2L2XD13_9FIRM|nr:thioredoxin [Desulfocucumis palustris]GBF34237.1 thioredoxin [Desulfocucumis palustris]